MTIQELVTKSGFLETFIITILSLGLAGYIVAIPAVKTSDRAVTLFSGYCAVLIVLMMAGLMTMFVYS